MSEHDNLKTIDELYAAFGRGDLPFILNSLAEDVDWQHPRSDIPWGGQWRGRDAVAQFFATINTHVEIEQFVPAQVVSRGDQVIVLGSERARTKSSGQVYGVEWAHVWSLQGGIVVGFREYTDTATIVEALTRDGSGSSQATV